MRKNSANLRVIQQRATANQIGPRTHTTTGPLRAAPVLPTMTGPVRKTRALPMTGAQKSGDGTGRTSLWAASMTVSGFDGMVAHDKKWDRTVNS